MPNHHGKFIFSILIFHAPKPKLSMLIKKSLLSPIFFFTSTRLSDIAWTHPSDTKKNSSEKNRPNPSKMSLNIFHIFEKNCKFKRIKYKTIGINSKDLILRPKSAKIYMYISGIWFDCVKYK